MIDHLGLKVSDFAKSKAFYLGALAPLGGLRLHYHPNYYAAFVLDPDGHNVEAVCHDAAATGISR
jgi:catechol 2,3-dioxygenase-like lactoylglutathione lyase family enzyme